MAWLDVATNEIPKSAKLRWKLEWKEYTTKFIAEWGTVVPDVGPIKPNVGERVLRRLKVMESVRNFSGNTYAAALTKMFELGLDVEYQGASMSSSVAGQWTVSATRMQYDPEGWSAWIGEDDFISAFFPPPAGA